MLKQFAVVLITFAASTPSRASSYYPIKLDDPKAVYLTRDKFPVHADGVSDDTDAFNKPLGLAKTLMSMNQSEKALPLLEHAVKLDPTSAVAHFRLSTVYRQMGRTADAKRELEEYQKYKDMKEKLRELYRQMRLVPEKKENEDEPRN